MFRWDRWLVGAAISGLLTTIVVAPAIVVNGVTAVEAWALFSSFLGGIALYCKQHPPEIWNGLDRRKE